MSQLLASIATWCARISVDQSKAWHWRGQFFADVAAWFVTGRRWRDIREYRKPQSTNVN